MDTIALMARSGEEVRQAIECSDIAHIDEGSRHLYVGRLLVAEASGGGAAAVSASAVAMVCLW